MNRNEGMTWNTFVAKETKLELITTSGLEYVGIMTGYSDDAFFIKISEDDEVVFFKHAVESIRKYVNRDYDGDGDSDSAFADGGDANTAFDDSMKLAPCYD